MHSRRKFLIQGSMATTALLALKPFNSFAGASSSFTGFSSREGSLVFLHTAGLHPYNDDRVIRHIKDIKSKNSNAILLKAGQDAQDETGQLAYDVSIGGGKDLSLITSDYTIIKKGNLRTGIISAKPDETDVIQKINRLSAFLKKEKNCNTVVCLSLLGYKNKNAADDFTLAQQSTDLDIIIGGHTKNFQANPDIVLNRNNAEVIIHYASGDSSACGMIEISFDGQGLKKQISFGKQTA